MPAEKRVWDYIKNFESEIKRAFRQIGELKIEIRELQDSLIYKDATIENLAKAANKVGVLKTEKGN